jgi:hypothetical protein
MVEQSIKDLTESSLKRTEEDLKVAEARLQILSKKVSDLEDFKEGSILDQGKLRLLELRLDTHSRDREQKSQVLEQEKSFCDLRLANQFQTQSMLETELVQKSHQIIQLRGQLASHGLEIDFANSKSQKKLNLSLNEKEMEILKLEKH